MHRIALVKSGVVVSVALWDGSSAWEPVAAGLCDSTEDITDRPDVGPGWTFAGGVFTAPAEPDPPADPHGFVAAIAADGTLATATRTAAASVEFALVSAIQDGHQALIPGLWALLIAEYGISPADQSAVHAYALAFHIPGI